LKLLLFHHLVMAGTVVNAIEVAATLRDRAGHDVVVCASPGPLAGLVATKGLRCLPAPPARFHPSPTLMRFLGDVVRRERPDIVHVWDWWQCLDAYYAVHLPIGVPLVMSDMTMTLNRLLPRRLPTTFGTPRVLGDARAAGRRPVELIVPPVDVELNAPGAVDPRPFRAMHGVHDGDMLIVTVSRLGAWLKGESLFRTVAVMRTLGRDFPARFMIVGDGTERESLERLAETVNQELGRRVIILTGSLLDPRPAYAAADIVVGMGSSALRGMAFAKPVVIVGEQAFSAPLTPRTADTFYYDGMFGRGRGGPSNSGLLADLRALAEHPEDRVTLGRFSREFVVRHFALETVCARLERFLHTAARERPPACVSAADALRTAAIYLRERRFLTPATARD
jgi:glycosyltransferase involved in cell wall biosynthesis